MNKLFGLCIAGLIIQSCGETPQPRESVIIAGEKSKVFPGLESGGFETGLQQRGMDIKQTNGNGLVSFDGVLTQDNVKLTANLTGASPRELTSIRGSVMTFDNSDASKKESWFIPYLCSIGYSNSNAPQAVDWAQRHLKKGGDTIIGNVKFEIRGKNNNRMVDIYVPE